MTTFLGQDISSNLFSNSGFGRRDTVSTSSIHERFLNSNKIMVKPSTIAVKLLQKLVRQRVKYVDNLSSLDENWISGKSQLPDARTIEMMTAFIKSLCKIDQLSQSWHRKSKLLMSPLPSGGISAEIQHENFSLSLNIFNSGNIELEYEKDGYYDEVENLVQENFLQKTNDLICFLTQRS